MSLFTRIEYRRDWLNIDFFHKGDTETSKLNPR